jgi:hypothetical protein
VALLKMDFFDDSVAQPFIEKDTHKSHKLEHHKLMQTPLLAAILTVVCLNPTDASGQDACTDPVGALERCARDSPTVIGCLTQKKGAANGCCFAKMEVCSNQALHHILLGFLRFKRHDAVCTFACLQQSVDLSSRVRRLASIGPCSSVIHKLTLQQFAWSTHRSSPVCRHKRVLGKYCSPLSSLSPPCMHVSPNSLFLARTRKSERYKLDERLDQHYLIAGAEGLDAWSCLTTCRPCAALLIEHTCGKDAVLPDSETHWDGASKCMLVWVDARNPQIKIIKRTRRITLACVHVLESC